jgi:transcriptional regulator with XRE-family HTH domain
MRRLRLELGMTQERLSELTKLHRTYIGSVERGERNVSINNMERIATALQIDLHVLLQSASPAKVAI